MTITDIKANACDISIRSLHEGSLPLLEIKGNDLLDVNKTFDCGQCFRFEKVENTKHKCEFGGVAFGKYVSFANDGDSLYIYNATEQEFDNIFYDYLGFGDNYRAMEEDILSRSHSDALRNAVNFGHGIKILRQDPWETLCSFIISQNNNIPRIKKLVSALSRKMGSKIDTSLLENHGGAGEFYSFPDAKTVASYGVDVLAELKTGFRAKYIYDAANKVANNELNLETIFSMDKEDGANALMTVKGVGPKVAACTLLFGFAKHDAFPIDVWIKRVIAKYFSEDFTPQELGAYAGVAQQYLFYYERYLGGQEK